MNKFLSAFWVAVLVCFPNILYGYQSQPYLDAVPDDAVAIIAIQKPSRISNVLEENLSELIQIEEFRELLLGLSVDSEHELEELFDFSLEAIRCLSKFEYLTFFVLEDSSFALICNLKPGASFSLSDWIEQCPSWKLHDQEHGNVSFSNLDIVPKLLNFFQNMTVDYNQELNTIVFSSSENLSNDVVSSLELLSRGETPSRSIVANRRFKRSFSKLKDRGRSLVFGYFRPEKVLPLLAPTRFQSQDHVEASRLSEIVSCCFNIRLETLQSGQQTISADCIMANTYPPSGLAKEWRFYEEIEEVPPIDSVLSINQPIRLRIANLNRIKQSEILRQMHDQVHGPGSFDLAQEELFKDYGGTEIGLNRNSGLAADVWYRDPDGQGQKIHVSGVGNRELAEAFRRNAENFGVEKYGNFPKPEYVLENKYTCWFYSDSIAEKQFLKNLGVEKLGDRTVPNYGSVVGPSWVFMGKKKFIEPLMNPEFDQEQPFHQQMNVLFSNKFPISMKKLPIGWIEINWKLGRMSVIADWRYQYLKKKYKRKAFPIFMESTKRKFGHLAPRDHEDRLFAIVDCAVGFVMDKIDYDILAFASFENYCQWSWVAIPKQQ